MHDTKPRSTVDPDDIDAINGGAGEGDCITPDTPDQQPSGDSPWWRSLQDALGNLLK